MKLLIVGGKQKPNASELDSVYRWESGVVLKVDIKKQYFEKVINYSKPNKFEPQNASVIFKSSSVYKNNLITCTNTEILIFDLHNYKLQHKISNPYFNDLHHVIYDEKSNTFFVVSTGLDSLLQIDYNGILQNIWSVNEDNPWIRFDKHTDYRTIISTKPHTCHPNYVTLYKNKIFVTRFNQRDVINILDKNETLKIGVEKPHDGAFHLQKLYYTTVDGHVIIIDPEAPNNKVVININSYYNSFNSLGWCRGIWPITNEEVILGFTRIRPTKFKANLSWLKTNIKRVASLPTRIISVNLNLKKINWEINLEEKDMNGIFSIIKIK